MKTRSDKKKCIHHGSALILVVVVTVLLSVVGILFLMMTRVRDMAAGAAVSDKHLDLAVQATISQIQQTLVNDLLTTTGTFNTTLYDYPGNDPWLASLEPNQTLVGPPPVCEWPRISDLYNTLGSAANHIILTGPTVNSVDAIIPEYPAAAGVGYLADADGDGVADSRWVELNNFTAANGDKAYAALRIIDNCAMLNLNTAYGFNPASQGQLLSAADISKFMRGNDAALAYPSKLIINSRDSNESTVPAATPPGWPYLYHDNVVMMIENPNQGLGSPRYKLFDISDELEIRNRYLLTGKSIARFENASITYETFDWGRGEFTGGWNTNLRSKRIPINDTTDLGHWQNRLNPIYWGTNANPNLTEFYDRRHICTFYSFDRNVRNGRYMLVDAALAAYKALPAPNTPTAAQLKAVESIFRPTDLRPVDLRKMTDPAATNTGKITGNTVEARKNILQLLYMFRDYYYSGYIASGMTPANARTKAAEQSAQIVANMIDYCDDTATTTQGPFYNGVTTITDSSTGTSYPIDFGSQRNNNPTFINRSIIRSLILDVCVNYNNNPANTVKIYMADKDIGRYYPVSPAVPSVWEFYYDTTSTSSTPAAQIPCVYGLERQPFISEVYTNKTSSGVQVFAIELINPYSGTFNLENWIIQFGASTSYTLDNTYVIPSATLTRLGRLTIWTANTGSGYSSPPITPTPPYSTSMPAAGSNSNMGLGFDLQPGRFLRLKRPDPFTGQYLTVDEITERQRDLLFTNDGIHDTSRKDIDPNNIPYWGFVNQMAYPQSGTNATHTTPSLGLPNTAAANVTAKGYQLPVADSLVITLPSILEGFSTLGAFQKVAFISNIGGTAPKPITYTISSITKESEMRLDSIVESTGMLRYMCFLNRQTEGSLPGRINVNTAAQYVLEAAMDPVTTPASTVLPAGLTPSQLATDIIANRPYTSLGDLITRVPSMKYCINNPGNVGDTFIDNDLEEQDWVLSRLCNIFTVRSDTFTAYILVRLGTDGPQRRMMVIFDRSNIWSASDKPRIVALEQVPDPR